MPAYRFAPVRADTGANRDGKANGGMPAIADTRANTGLPAIADTRARRDMPARGRFQARPGPWAWT